ncbi:Adenosine monophosphate-protein transferase SoFic [termite gut metagenome]|uniref:Adenosine monophosphate-protein transferase SoFic n=1 Tax=termite gut metagenome TaxID=433724 RepID=A0A5J4SY12_9ZZZZ
MYYYDNLMRVRTHNDMNQWLKFFLTGVIETAKKGIETFHSIFLLQKSVDRSLEKMGKRSVDAYLVMHYLYKKPIISVATVTNIIGKTQQTAYTLISDLEEAKVLHEITGLQRNKLYTFRDYIDLF